MSGFHGLANTQLFREAALDWKKNGGEYTRAPEGSREFNEYWDLQEQRCRDGMSVAGTWITGRHYFYLNFTPILKVPDHKVEEVLLEIKKGGKISSLTQDKILEFPKFWEIDYEWWRFKNIAWFGGEFMGVHSPGGKNICCVKARGAGFSYKEAADGVYNFTFIPNSKSYYFAGLEQYLTTDGILNKVQGMLDFINQHNSRWRQNRMQSNTLMEMKASFIDDQQRPKGSMSEIIGVIVDNPNKTRGKRGVKITFEEAGSFKNLKKALGISVATVADGGFRTGQISVFGTGGEEGPGIEGLEDVFQKPDTYNMLAFPDVHGEGLDSCGYFVPAFRCNSMFMDIDGNVQVEEAVRHELREREIKAKSNDPKDLDMRKAEYPMRPREAFQRLARNPFYVTEIDAQIKRIQTSKAIQALLRYGSLHRDPEKGILFNIKPKHLAKPVEEYPHAQRGDLTGCITVVERPWVNHDGFTPPGMYETVFDPYYKEESEDMTSLFAVYVIKMFNPYDMVNDDLPVAWYVGRPEDLDYAYEQLFMLADWYNSKVQGEVAGGGQGVIDYASKTMQLDKVHFEPEMLHNKEIASNMKNRSYLMNMPTERKRLGLTYLIDWHKRVRGLDENKKPIRNLHRIYDIGMLREMRKFDGKRNADRLSANIVGRFMAKERVALEVQRTEEEADDFYKRPLYGAGALESYYIPQT